MGTRFLRSFSNRQCKTTLKHIKALGCSIFKLAVEEELLEVNPWHDVLIPRDAVESNPTKHYTLEEAENIISALKEHPDSQLIMALSCFLGLRPSEIVGLHWPDFGPECLSIRRAVVRGVCGTLKTRESIVDIPLVDQRVIIPLELWRQCPQRTSSEWVFPNDTGGHLHDLGNIVGRKIKPAVVKAGLEWKGVYGGRRGACTAAIEATGGNYAVAATATPTPQHEDNAGCLQEADYERGVQSWHQATGSGQRQGRKVAGPGFAATRSFLRRQRCFAEQVRGLFMAMSAGAAEVLEKSSRPDALSTFTRG